ncbi:aminopeptidase P family protein [Histidinibacterium lentulum]|uniref:Aminopeptidase P family protein n=1 Tax=Histidinibacterium lentulum TaxID=2480588 RepID=A0A3N2QYJ0_9RHOB|nr:aminopeptidase P family protein [Histidinibacterium lentulum]ROU00275.1 aminopeptidase P family protein [Histidinibacterium lentulum]
MFQTFETTASPDQGPPRIAALRGLMAEEGLDAVLIPRADAHQGEYVAPCDARLKWLTGFTGSAGFCAVTGTEAGLFVDGRYRVQARSETDSGTVTPVPWPETKLADWLSERLPSGAVLGFDPWLHTLREVAALRKDLGPRGITLRAIANPVDRLWQDRPAPPAEPIAVYPDDMAGETSASKRNRLGETLAKAGHAAAALTQPDGIAWLLNIRGSDIPRNPVPLCFAILRADGTATLHCTEGQAEGLTARLGPDVAIRPKSAFLDDLAAEEGPVRLAPATAPQALADRLAEAGIAIAEDEDPCALPRACKTPAEIAGARAAQLRDGAAMARFLHWLDETAPGGALTEIDVVRALEGFRRDTNALRDISFDTIAGAGEHGAIVHYRVTEATNRAVRAGELLLVDSGGQYMDGTTDITRTIAIGPPGEEERTCYTLVLKGMIAISRARFPKGVAGRDLDALARVALWMRGRDYDHGTGHGVGAYLSVHEGPQGLSRRSVVPLEPGMILSNEPGYYREGAFGIRIENLIAVREAAPLPGGDLREMLEFETLTWVPFDRRLIDTALLSDEERGWIDRYHADTVAHIAPRLDGGARDWLTAACAPLGAAAARG